MSAWKQVVLVLLLLGAAGYGWAERESLGLAALLQPAEKERPGRGGDRGVPVLVALVEMAEDDLALEAVGTGRARRSVMLRPEAEGKVVELPLSAGERFAAGDVLLRLEDTEQRLALQLAETRLSEAERVRARFARLQDSGTAAQARLDEVRTAAEIAAIELERAREALEDRVVRAPFDGVAGIASIDVGAWIDSDIEIATFDDRSAILVEFDLPEALLGRVRPGMAVTATTPAAPVAVFEGSVEAIDSRITQSSRTVRVRVALPNPEDQLRPGASFTVRLELEGGQYPMVPELAVQFSRGTLHVWRVTGETAEQVEIRLVRRRHGEVLVDGDLAEGDAVVIEGTQRLAPGKKVRVLEMPVAGGSS